MSHRDEVSRLLRKHLDTDSEVMESEIDRTVTRGWIIEATDG